LGSAVPRIFDNIEQSLLPALRDTLNLADHADFCVGYFNLRGWKQIDAFVDRWDGGPGHCCRLLVGMQRLPQEGLRIALSVAKGDDTIDNQTAIRLKKRLAEEFREQLTVGVPTNADEAGLRRLATQITAKKVVVKLFLRHPLHAKLYMLFRPDPVSPLVGYLGSSNLTLAGLSQQGELNVDVLDQDACQKLARWFEDRWDDRLCIDISDELVQIIRESWAREEAPLPYHIYLKIAYHLSQEARAGLAEFRIPRDFGNELFEFQVAAVKIAAHHLNKRGGVLIGDVVGLGKTLMAMALARIFEDDQDLETLILCPKNLVPMWEDYRERYRLRGKVLSTSQAQKQLGNLRRYRLIIIDESHNLRNREGKRYKAIQEYIQKNESRVVLLSATPYNKTYLDLSNQIRLFISEEEDVGVRPECLLKELGETEFIRRHQCSLRSVAAFEKSEYADDWRELMRLYLVRRTRSFIKDNYARTDSATQRKYLEFADHTRSYFPERVPRTVKFALADAKAGGQYATLYAPDVVDTINDLNLPRYGLANYVAPSPHEPPTPKEAKVLDDLSRAGKRLMGFCRTGLFKRLESSGQAFLQSLERHVLRNFIFLHAIENGLDLPIGTQDAAYLDERLFDDDVDAVAGTTDLFDDEENDDDSAASPSAASQLRTDDEYKRRASEVYDEYRKRFARRFRWLRPSLFDTALTNDLKSDAQAVIKLLNRAGTWDADRDAKLAALVALLTKRHSKEKVLIFTQFADTVQYLNAELKRRGVTAISGVTGSASNPTALAWRFSPTSNRKREQIAPADELRVLVATDVLSEGQNLQDCAVVVNYDLPWAIIRLVQRVGRVDRIGQQASRILCYSFLPAEGVEKIIKLRQRLRTRLRQNAEVVGTDEAFFGDERGDRVIVDLYHEKSGILDGEDDTEVDLASYAFQIWKNAIERDPSLQNTIPALPPVVYSTKPHAPTDKQPEGALVYVKTADGNDALAWVDKSGNPVTESQSAILKAAECNPTVPALERLDNHHDLVRKGFELIAEEERTVGGQLGRPSGARFRTYERLKRYAEEIKDTLFDTRELHKAIDETYRYPLRPTATDTLNRQLRSGISDASLAELVIALREEGRLCIIHEEEKVQEPRIICSMGLRDHGA
jgi:superfamily II DNA or RNA helicase